MCSLYSLSKFLLPFHILAIQLTIRSVSSMNLTNEYLHHKCRINQGKYQRGSAYEKDLNSLTQSISTEKFIDGFIHRSNSEGPNSTTVIFQCRGDSYESKCRSCYATALTGFRRRCPGNKGGIIWYDQCFLDVSMINDQAPRKVNYENTFSMHNRNSVTGDIKSFNKKTTDFLNKLIGNAEKADSLGELIYYAAGEENIGTKKVYAMVQCAKDLADCKSCLEWSIRKLSKCCGSKQGARLLGTSCNVRYELYPFLRT